MLLKIFYCRYQVAEVASHFLPDITNNKIDRYDRVGHTRAQAEKWSRAGLILSGSAHIQLFDFRNWNHFYPSFKLEEKVLVHTRHRRIYLAPMTPYDRVMESPFVDKKEKEKLREIHQTLNPIALQKALERKKRNFFDLLKKLKKARHKRMSA